MKITFKYVGQGDCILLEWKYDNSECVGIIDCKKRSGYNSIIDDLAEKNLDTIRFIFLSHPHSDHYSGINGLLKYCDKKEINIRNFFHTVIEPSKIVRSIYEVEDRNSLEELLCLVNELYKKDRISNVGQAEAAYPTMTMNEDFELSILSPSNHEKNLFYEGHYTEDMEEKSGVDLNLLSTIILLKSDDNMFIFTSDATRESFKRIHKKFESDVNNLKLSFGQVSHHGSKHSFYKKWWHGRQLDDNSAAIISVGPNGYGHPHDEVVKSLNVSGYETLLTGDEQELMGGYSQAARVKDSILSQGFNQPRKSHSDAGDIAVEVQEDSGAITYDVEP